MKKTKRFLSAILAVIMLLSTSAFAVNAGSSSTDDAILAGNNIVLCENSNAAFTAQFNSASSIMSIADDPVTSAIVAFECISNGKCTASVKFSYNNTYQFMASGEIEEYTGGYIGVLQGFHIINGTPQLVTVDFASATNGDALIIINIGYITDDVRVPILVYGNYTTAIENLYMQEQAMMEPVSAPLVQSDVESCSVDANIRYQGSSPIRSSGLSFGSLSVFHTNELRNQGYTTIYAKINTDCAAVINYIKSNYQVALDTATATADKFNVRIAANDGRVYAATNSYSPVESQTTQTIDVPFYAGKKLGVQVVPIPLVTSSVDITASKYGNPLSPNVLDWELFKAQGFYGIDGDYTTESGMSVYADFVCAGTVTNNVNISINSRGAIRYRCQYLPNSSATQMISFHLTTGTTSKTTTMTLIP